MKGIQVTFTTDKFTDSFDVTFLCADPSDQKLIRDTINRDLKESFASSSNWHGMTVKDILLIEDAPDENRPGHGTIFVS